MKKFSQRLSELRSERRLTQAGLASALNKTRSTISGYETEGKEPDFETLCTLARFFGVSTDYLLGFSDTRTHTEAVFINDTQNFKTHYEGLPTTVKETVAKMYDSFYLLLSKDMRLGNEERLALYSELFSTLQRGRAEIRNSITLCGGQVTDPVLLSELVSSQNTLKSDVAALLDKLMQADIDTAFDVKKGLELSEKLAT